MNKKSFEIGGYRHGHKIFGVFLGAFDAAFQVHTKDWAVGVSWWTPAAISVTLGPFTVKLGVSNMEHFYGVGFGYVTTGKYWYGFLSNKLWWERA